MIRRLKYNEIDFDKYSRCLENSEQRKYSASKLFLDITARKNWEILVLNDYEAIMPVPFIRKFGLKIIINPRLCQQLGIFSEKDDVHVNDHFLTFFKKKYNIWYYPFNDQNTFSIPLNQRKNFLIPPAEYEVVRQKYSPKRKRKLRLDEEVLALSEIKDLSMQEASSFISEHLIGTKNDHDKQEFIKTFQDFDKAGSLTITSFLYENKIINSIAVYHDDKTAALLGTFNDKEFVKLSGSSVLIDHVIKKNIKNKIFDFEGSEVSAIEEFFRGFRPELKPYPFLRNSKKEIAKEVLILEKFKNNFL
ncbi:hypothetical protein MKJ01_11065 [Chryseobacterium sp. SSA4.19]|uniref:hypothetical protein n=1 Tax=Chryseobacterium sp. SSA4.19 TaxID=2919915 RepID=UPI001F4D9F20|nr:hypothetical protein [Chryseobacterium sp. SSA4.19]MCJ8154299.1 hypothetical protein [Chryseobacterium sp. SSA4.19]